MAPDRDEYIQPQTPEPLEPGPLGQRPKQTGGQVFIPTPYAAQLGVGTTPEERGTPHTDDLAQQLFLTSQTPFDLGYQVFREAQVLERLFHNLGGVLRLAAISCEALVRFETTMPSGFSEFLCTSFG
jgi:hypothetical protein